MKSFRHVWSPMTKLWEFLYRCPGATRRLPCCLLEQRYVTSRGLYVEELRQCRSSVKALCVQVLLETGIQKVSRTQPSLWGRSPSFSFWLAICWVSLGFAAGSYKTCGHAADQSQSCVCTRLLYKLAFCSLGRREAFFKGFPCVLWSIWDWKCPLLVLALENCEKKGWQYRPAICRPIVYRYFMPCSPCHV